jgi:flagellum-specific ATP synthase
MSTLATRMDEHVARAESVDLVAHSGRVSRVVGLVIESTGPRTSVGRTCWVCPGGEAAAVLCEVVGFRDNTMLLMPLGDIDGIGPGCEVIPTGQPMTVPVGEALLGRVVGGLGEPVDGKGPLGATQRRSIYAQPPDPLRRRRITEPMPIGIRAIDAFLTCGKGQRIGVFSGAGVGKSMLLGQIARCSSADVNVIALVGERGREAREFVDKCLGPKGLMKSVVVLVTSDQHALLRLKGAYTAMTVAEYFRERGKNVLLTVDSVTRIARAQRELGLSIGEPPATRGYTPSVFELMPRLLERAAIADQGSITGIFAVLVEGDDLDEPVSDLMRATVDGHIVLSRKLATRNHFPAIDVLASISRCMPDIVDGEHYAAAGQLRLVYAIYEDARDMINLGAYAAGSSPHIDNAIRMVPKLEAFLRQLPDEDGAFQQTRQTLVELAADSVAPKLAQLRLAKEASP